MKDEMVVMAAPALLSKPGTFVFHPLARTIEGLEEWNEITPCGYSHEWITMARSVAECLGRPCKAPQCQRAFARRHYGHDGRTASPMVAS